MNIHNLPSNYCLVDAASFNGEIMHPSDQWLEDANPPVDAHLYATWLLLRERDEAVDKRWASLAQFLADATALEGYIGEGRELDCTYYGSRVLSASTCVWSPVRYALLSVRDGDELYFDNSHYYECMGRIGGEQSKTLLRRKIC